MKPTHHPLLSMFSLLLALALAPPAFAQATPPAVQAQEFKLSNGFTVIVKPDHRAPTAVQMVWVRVGSMKAGAVHAHLLRRAA